MSTRIGRNSEFHSAQKQSLVDRKACSVQSFRDFFTDLNSYLLNPEHSSLRRSIVAEVIKVTDGVVRIAPIKIVELY